MIENIKTVYKAINNKKAIKQVLADEFKMSVASITSTWVSLWAIPEDKQERVLQIMQNYLKKQIAEKEEALLKSFKN